MVNFLPGILQEPVNFLHFVGVEAVQCPIQRSHSIGQLRLGDFYGLHCTETFPVLSIVDGAADPTSHLGITHNSVHLGVLLSNCIQLLTALLDHLIQLAAF